MEHGKKKWGRPRKGETPRATLVSVLLNDEELEAFRAIQREMRCTQSEAMRAAFATLREEKARQGSLFRSHQIGFRIDAEELAELEQLQARLHTSKSGVFKHAIALLGEKLGNSRRAGEGVL